MIDSKLKRFLGGAGYDSAYGTRGTNNDNISPYGSYGGETK